MAHIYRDGARWRVQIARKGVRLSRNFVAKKAAELWALQQETAIIDGDVSKWPRKTVRDALDRYAEDVSPTKRSSKAESLRLAAFTRDFPALASKLISDFSAADAAHWRDARLKLVSPATVKRESNSLRAVWQVAIKEWGWCGSSPWRAITLPRDGAPRDRVIGWREARAILRRLDYRTHHPPVSGLQSVAWAFLVALRTGLRAGEVLGLERQDVQGSVAIIRQHKTQHITGKPRRVPLTPQGARLLAALAQFAEARGRARLLVISSSSMDAQFRDAVGGLLIDGLHFHDSRRTALTHLSRRLDVMALAMVSGHRDLRILHRVYYGVTPEEIAARLAQR
jgi:integrase